MKIFTPKKDTPEQGASLGTVMSDHKPTYVSDKQYHSEIHQETQKLTNEIIELNQQMQQVNKLVHERKDQVDVIEFKVEEAGQDVEKATAKLEKKVEEGNKRRKLVIWMVICVLAIVGMIILSFCVKSEVVAFLSKWIISALIVILVLLALAFWFSEEIKKLFRFCKFL